MSNSKYEDLFISEAEDYIEQVSDNVLLLEKDSGNKEAISSIFRAMHTIKGMAASMGYMSISQIAHQMEDIMDLIRNDQIALYNELIDLLLKGTDYINMLVHKQNVDEDVLRSFKAVLNSIKEGSKINAAPQAKAEQTPSGAVSGSSIKVIFTDDVMLKSARAFVVIKTVQDAGIFTGTEPGYDDIMKENFGNYFNVIINDEETAMSIVENIKIIPEVKDAEIVKRASLNTAVNDSTPSAQLKKDMKVSLDRLDNLQNYASELVIARGRLQQLAYQIQNEELINALHNTSKIITNIQDEVMKIRMVPVWQVFDRYPRYVRDLSSKLGKKVDFVVKGRDIELDRSLLNALAEPLLHLLRNSMDHGVETPEERLKMNKSKTGTLILEAKRLKNAVMITVTDDGKGLDTDKILRKAIEKGLINEDQAGNLSRQEIFHFITHSGFSTKEAVSDVSGRGVGVDAVRTVLKTIGGSLEIDSQKGKGTVFKLKVPLTLAIIKALTVRVKDETYIVPLTHISETIDIKASSIQSIMNREIFILREHIIPIIRLSEMFKIENQGENDECSLVIVDVDDNQFGILIDEFVEQSEVVVKSLKGLLAGIPGLAGVTILNDGMPSFIIDVPVIFEMAKVG